MRVSGTKRRVKKFIIFLLAAFFIILLAVVFFKGSVVGDKRFSSGIERNKIIMEGLKLVYIPDNESYVNLFSREAFADKLASSVEMRNVGLEYGGGDMKIYATADRGTYEMERILRAYGGITGRMDDFNFEAGRDAALVYDYKEGRGRVENGITVYQGRNNIRAGRAEFDVNENFVLFTDNVTVDYSSAEPPRRR